MSTAGPSTLAYVFWHWPAGVGSEPAYETDLTRFYASLAARPPAGFLGSAALVGGDVSWLPVARTSYEDWYLVRDWTAVGDLNRDAVASTHVSSHDAIAHQTEGCTGGMYALHSGDPQVGAAATWFAKPSDWSDAELEAALEAVVGEGFALWRRQLVLGPAPEFCLRGRVVPTLPAAVAGEPVTYRVLHSSLG